MELRPKRKKNGKTVSVKNPYVKGMKTIVAEAEAFDYQGSARKEFEMIATGADNTYGGVLNYNRAWKLAWAIGEEDGLLYVFKPVEKKDGRWTIYCSRLLPQGRTEYLFDRTFGDYPSEAAAIDGIWKEVQRHKELLEEWLSGKGKPVAEAKFSPRDLMMPGIHARQTELIQPTRTDPSVSPFIWDITCRRLVLDATIFWIYGLISSPPEDKRTPFLPRMNSGNPISSSIEEIEWLTADGVRWSTVAAFAKEPCSRIV